MLAGQKIRYSEKYNEISLYGFFGWSVTEIMMIMKDFTLQSIRRLLNELKTHWRGGAGNRSGTGYPVRA